MRTTSFIVFICICVTLFVIPSLQITPCQTASYLRKAGFPEHVIPQMVCTAKYESSYNCRATNINSNGSEDYGLFQCNDYWWCSGSKKSKVLFEWHLNGCDNIPLLTFIIAWWMPCYLSIPIWLPKERKLRLHYLQTTRT